MQVSQSLKVNHGRKASQPIIETQDEKASQEEIVAQRELASQRSKKPDMIERVNRS